MKIEAWNRVEGAPARPAGVEEGAWRRASTLGRLGIAAAWPILPADAETTVLWVTRYGELDATARFLDRLAQEGPANLSAAAFQTSLPHTGGAQLSMVAGIQGPLEAFAGAGALEAALDRAALLLELGDSAAVLLVAADSAHPAAPGALSFGAAMLLRSPRWRSPRTTTSSSVG